MSSAAPRYAAAGPCPRCGSTDTYADVIEVPRAGDVRPYRTIPGEIHCRACEAARLAVRDRKAGE